MCPRVRALQSFDPERGSVKAYVLNPQVNRFTTAQAVPIHHQEEQVITYAIPATLSSLKKRLNLSRIEEVLPSMRISNVTFHIIPRLCQTRLLRSLRTRSRSCQPPQRHYITSRACANLLERRRIFLMLELFRVLTILCGLHHHYFRIRFSVHTAPSLAW